MKQFKKFAAAALLLASSAFANAAIISYDLTDFSPAGVVEVKKDKPFTYTFNFNEGFDFIKGSDTITAAWLTVSLSDDGGGETFSFFLNTKNVLDDKNIDGKKNAPAITNYPNLLLGNSLVTALNNDGFLNLSIGITAGNGSFDVVSSSLRAQVEREIANPAEVPEPMSLTLLGLGLAGIASVRRRKA
jgi:hypothetical protein